jgi:hypothetical protein
LQAEKALCKNAKVFDNSLMVGVVECTDTAVINQTRQSALRPAPIERTTQKRTIDDVLDEENLYVAQRKRLRTDEELVKPERGIWSRILDNVLSF